MYTLNKILLIVDFCDINLYFIIENAIWLRRDISNIGTLVGSISTDETSDEITQVNTSSQHVINILKQKKWGQSALTLVSSTYPIVYGIL